jgi:hypothetical protein
MRVLFLPPHVFRIDHLAHASASGHQGWVADNTADNAEQILLP